MCNHTVQKRKTKQELQWQQGQAEFSRNDNKFRNKSLGRIDGETIEETQRSSRESSQSQTEDEACDGWMIDTRISIYIYIQERRGRGGGRRMGRRRRNGC